MASRKTQSPAVSHHGAKKHGSARPDMAGPSSFFHPDCHGRLRNLTGSASALAWFELDPAMGRAANAPARGLYRRWGLLTPPRRSFRTDEPSRRAGGCQNRRRGGRDAGLGAVVEDPARGAHREQVGRGAAPDALEEGGPPAGLAAPG